MIITALDIETPDPITETDDLPDNNSTTTSLALYQTFSGLIDGSIDDRGDRLRIELEAGVTYRISLTGDTLDDPYLYLYGDQDTFLRANDDSGPGLNSLLFFTPQTSGSFFIEASFYRNWNPDFSPTGTYTLSLSTGQGQTILGSGQDDIITGSLSGDRLEGFAGDDLIDGNGGADRVFGGAGNDTIEGTGPSSTIAAGSGDDVISTTDGARVFAGLGNDAITLSGSGIRVYTGDGDDTVTSDGGGRFSSVYLGKGNDSLVFEAEDYLSVTAGGGHDTVSVAFGRVQGGFGNDVIQQIANPDVNDFRTAYFNGQAGHDQLSAANSSAALFGGTGNDTLTASAQGNLMEGGDGNDSMAGGAGNDNIFGNAGRDTITGSDGADRISGGLGDDSLDGGDGDDRIGGAGGNDTASGGQGDDTLWTADGDDLITGGAGNDLLWGGQGDDTLDGGSDDDLLRGSGGADTLFGGSGDDTMIGGSGADVFIFSEGADFIQEFQTSPSPDQLDLSAVAAITDFADLVANHATEMDGSVVIDDGSGNETTLFGLGLADISDAIFVF